MNREQSLARTRAWRKTKRGVVTNIYSKMKYRYPVEFDLQWLHDFAQCKKFDRLFSEWERSGHQKKFKPTIDRISRKHSYMKNNVQWLSWGENRFKQTMERRRRKGPVAQIKDGKVIEIHRSQREAVRATGICQSGISMTLLGSRSHAGGYSWAYIHENKELLDE